jgi:protein-tyrosine phosphatase
MYGSYSAPAYGISSGAGYANLLPNGMLAQGSAPPVGVRLPFDVIVLAAEEYQPDLPGYEVVRLPIDDARPDAGTRARIRTVAEEIALYVRAGKRVLVTCFQGRNRSGVLAGLALVELGATTPQQAVRRIRMNRTGALTNPYFRTMVEGTFP